MKLSNFSLSSQGTIHNVVLPLKLEMNELSLIALHKSDPGCGCGCIIPWCEDLLSELFDKQRT